MYAELLGRLGKKIFFDIGDEGDPEAGNGYWTLTQVNKKVLTRQNNPIITQELKKILTQTVETITKRVKLDAGSRELGDVGIARKELSSARPKLRISDDFKKLLQVNGDEKLGMSRRDVFEMALNMTTVSRKALNDGSYVQAMKDIFTYATEFKVEGKKASDGTTLFTSADAFRTVMGLTEDGWKNLADPIRIRAVVRNLVDLAQTAGATLTVTQLFGMALNMNNVQRDNLSPVVVRGVTVPDKHL